EGRHQDDPKPALRTIAVIFGLHILLTLAIQFGFRLKNGKLPLFFTGDIWEFALQAATLAIVFHLFQRLMKPGIKGTPSHAMRILGDISFPLYLVHFPVFEVLKHWDVHSPVLYYAAAVMVAAVIYRTVDFYSQRRPAQGAQATSASPFDEKVSATLAVTAMFSTTPVRPSGAVPASKAANRHDRVP
ncbi:MAG TPA: acyltransferase family protein, partial [Variovorax sp.]|nr:acyltransferase family protein [Variovorax sp.]